MFYCVSAKFVLFNKYFRAIIEVQNGLGDGKLLKMMSYKFEACD